MKERARKRSRLSRSHTLIGRPRSIDFVALTKPRLNLLVVATSAAGYYLGAPGGADVTPMAATAAGTALVAGGRGRPESGLRTGHRCADAADAATRPCRMDA